MQDWQELAKNRICAVAPSGKHHPGFHGDVRLIEIIEDYLSSSECFIETGTYLAGTLFYVASNFKDIECYSCEPIKEFFDEASKVVSSCDNVNLFRAASPDFIKDLVKDNPDLKNKKCLFWLDGHGQSIDSSPIPAEVQYILSNFENPAIFIDDIQVPGLDGFEWQFSSEYFADIIKLCSDSVSVVLPSYTVEQTSCIANPVGWALLTSRQDVDYTGYPVTLIKEARNV